MKKKQPTSPYPPGETYPTAAPARASEKTIGAERDIRGKYHAGGIERTGRRAASHMQATKPRGKTWGPSEAHAIAQRDGDGTAATGSFDPVIHNDKPEPMP